jgi:hypothetical protein
MSGNSIHTFISLLGAGLWEKAVSFSSLDIEQVYRLGSQQSVIGLLAAGLEHVTEAKAPKDITMQIMSTVISMEQRNLAMNAFNADLFQKMEAAGIKAFLVKGQGIAQCYERPLWRACGDVDLFLDEENYQKAKAVLIPTAKEVEQENVIKKHLGMTLGSHLVELHGAMHTDVSARIDAVVDEVQRDIFENRGVRFWDNDGTSIPLPSPDNDVIIIFTHFIGHFYVGGMGLRQISDWCRLLWTYKDEIDRDLLGKRLNAMKLMPEWKAFAAFAVELLDMPAEAMPFYNVSAKNTRRALRIQSLMLHTGNFGHNRDESYRRSASKLIVKIRVFFHRFGEFIRLFTIFPSNTPKFFVTYVIDRVKGD